MRTGCNLKGGMNHESAYVPRMLRVLLENMKKSNNPIGIAGSRLSSWANGLDLPRSGHTLLYTGCEYQLVPYVLALVDQIKKIGPFGYESDVLKLAMALRRIGFDAAGALATLTAKDETYYNRVMRAYAQVLKKHGVEFAYLGEEEPYSGALLYEYGFMEEFAQYAKSVSELFKEKKVKRVIVTSPHVLEAFRVLYPKFVEDFDVEVLHFIEVLLAAKEEVIMGLRRPMDVTLHDPCHLARTLNMVEQPRQILSKVKNVTLKEVPHANGRMTTCCGAPIETLLPNLSEQLAAKRVEELASTGAETALTMCAFCLSNLRRASSEGSLKVADFAEFLQVAMEGQ
jgi:Fe-S oxidoreductase